jgi:hypothetical protein
LNDLGFPARVIVVTHRRFPSADYVSSIKQKYIHCKNLVFNDVDPDDNDITFVTGRSMITLAYQDFDGYTLEQQNTLRKLFSKNTIPVYSENHPINYPKALDFFQPKKIIDLCDQEVYPNGTGEHFEKTINFDIYKPVKNESEFKYLFLGTNNKYYATVESVIHDFPNHGILVYNDQTVNDDYNNIVAPANNLLGKFDTYVYTKNTFDPAPRLFQECRYFGKNIIYKRSKTIHDGGSVYWNRDIKKPDITPIEQAIEKLNENRT